ncbi:MAG TPA: hypothetical protein VG102_03240 [Candidatus Paceibacterota bacterium]|jgi:hypothetical protein|nr:hypothetical protein [Candidatus Paceibacterota bacterium]
MRIFSVLALLAFTISCGSVSAQVQPVQGDIFITPWAPERMVLEDDLIEHRWVQFQLPGFVGCGDEAVIEAFDGLLPSYATAVRDEMIRNGQCFWINGSRMRMLNIVGSDDGSGRRCVVEAIVVVPVPIKRPQADLYKQKLPHMHRAPLPPQGNPPVPNLRMSPMTTYEARHAFLIWPALSKRLKLKCARYST